MFKKITRSTLTAIGLLPFSLFADDIRPTQSENILTNTRLIAELQVGGKLGGDLDLLVPLHGDNMHLWYGDLQAYGYGNEYRTYGIGMGYRQVIKDAIYGAYGFFDRQISVNKIYYNRANIGFERLGETWDFRTNFYYYTNTKTTNIADLGRVGASIDGNRILYTHLYDIERIRSGADIEVGRTLGVDNLRAYLGYYNFGNVIKGPKARIEYQVNPRVMLSASTQNDVRGTQTYAGVSYWFGKTTLPAASGIETRMLDPVVRDMTVAANIVDSYAEYDVDPRNIYFAQPDGVPSGVSAGLSEANTPTIYSLQDAIAASKDNDIIYLVGGTTPYDISNGITLKSGQTLLGSTQDLSINGFLLKQGDPTQTVNLAGGSISVTDGGILSGFSLDGTGATGVQSGITVNGSSVVSISDVSVINFDNASDTAGVAVLGSAPVTLTNIRSDHNGIGLTATAGSIVIAGSSNSFSNNAAGAGIAVSNAAQLVSAQNVVASNNSADGILLNSSNTIDTVNLDNITSSNNARNGINILQAGAVNLTGSTTTSTNHDSGLRVNNSNMTVTIDNIISDHNTNYGLRIEHGTVNTSDTGTNSFSDNLLKGVYVTSSDSALTLYNAIISSNTQYGIHVSDGQVDIYNTNISGTKINDGLAVQSTLGHKAVVNLYGSSIYDNNRNGILAYGVNGEDTTLVTVNDSSSIYGNLDDAIEVNESAQVTVISPLKLEGIIARPGPDTAGNASITVNEVVQVNAANEVRTCDINGDQGSCHA